MENWWQYSKFYPSHGLLEIKLNTISITPNGLNQSETLQEVIPTDTFLNWQETNIHKNWADRYPMGKDARPLCSIIQYNKQFYACDYIQARKLIYAPAYAASVQHTKLFPVLKEKIRNKEPLILIDYDATDISKGWDYVLNDPTLKMGHATVLAALLLEEYRYDIACEEPYTVV